MFTVSDCKINSKIYESAASLVYRGIRESDNTPVILKILKETYPSPDELVRYRQEYEITRDLNLSGVVKTYGQEKYGNSLAIILEDLGGESLSILNEQRRFSISEILDLAIRITTILGEIHKAQVIHKDINPSNIILNRETGELNIIDFGISSRLSREIPELKNPERLEGTLKYMSPEQTGRMNRALDYRTDFYALGASLYELLTGRAPFTTQDPLELTHCHLARNPPAPKDINPELSDNLSNVLLKLLAKQAEDRYQTTAGLIVDLEFCKKEWKEKSSDTSFSPGEKDIPARFQLPQKLYGRDNELNTLSKLAEQATAGTSQALFVTGYSGVGKSALVKELHRNLIRPESRRGYFITGKFDQYHRNIPYSAVRDAFRDLMRQLLTENEKRLSLWKHKILEVLGPNVQIIIDFLPELKQITGKQEPVPNLDPLANRNRFALTLRNFVSIFLEQEHNLVIFLDDLQWADLASLELIKLITTKTDFLFFIGAYRDNEVFPGHPLPGTIDEIADKNVSVYKISLAPLDLSDIQGYIADATRRKLQETTELAELIKYKTAGNPFFMGELLETMVRDGLLRFDVNHEYWLWDMKQIQELDISDNVVVLVTERIRSLPEETKLALTRAACLGNTFDLDTLALIHEKSPAETAGDLWPALELGMLLPLRNEYKIAALGPLGLPRSKEKRLFIYKFGHDRIEEASYNLIPEQERINLHLKTGRLLLTKFNRKTNIDENTEGRLFALVDHLNLGRIFIKSQDEQDSLAHLNFRAGSVAQTSTAYGPALSYYKIGLEVLAQAPENSWRRAYELTLNLMTGAAESAMLSNDFEQMNRFTQEALDESKHILDAVKLYVNLIKANIARNELFEAIEIALLALSKLGVHLSKKPGKGAVIFGLVMTKIRLARKSSDALLALPDMDNPAILAASRILETVSFAAFLTNPNLLPLLVFKQIKLSLKYGYAPSTPTFYNGYAIVLCNVLNQIEAGYEYGKLAQNSQKNRATNESRAKVIYIFNILIRHWKEPLRESGLTLLELHKLALEIGDPEIGALTLVTATSFSIWSGSNLKVLENELVHRARAVSDLGQKTSLNYLNINQQAIQQLREFRKEPALLEGEFYSQKKMLPVHIKSRDGTALHLVHFWNMILSFLFQEDPVITLQKADEIAKHLGAAKGLPSAGSFNLYDSLIRLATYPSASKPIKKAIRKHVKRNQKQIKHWARHAPMNQSHRFYLVEAEWARVHDQPAQARLFYDKAIELAHENDFNNDEALAWELAGRFYLEQGPAYSAHFFLNNARYAYLRWGADAKVTQLEQLYPDIFTSTNSTGDIQLNVSTTSRKDGSALDLSTIIKASQAISSEIVLDSLLHNMMRLLLENAGAEKGAFILKKDGNLFLEAQATVNPQGGFKPESTDTGELIGDERTLPLSLLDFTMRTGDVLVLPNAREAGDFTGSEYIRKNQVLSVLCVPVRKQGRVIGLLYLENNLTSGAFTATHVKVIEILTAQIDLSMENARLYANLEDKVKQRTEELETALGNVNALKTQQDGDYFLTSVLLKPLCENTATDKRILSDILLKQYKEFQYEQWNAEIGGDMCACHDVTLQGKTYTLFLNADAMGKSMQGAGGSLVLLAALKALLGKVNSSPLLQNQSPSSWLAGAYSELHQIFATFNGFMQVTLIMGLADGDTKRLHFFNGEHPRPVLLRRGEARYFGETMITHKLGHHLGDPTLSLETMALESGDIVLMGSDGKDDLQSGFDAEGNRLISNDPNVFLECVMEAEGDPDRIREILAKKGDFIDDFSLLRLRVR